MDRIALLLAVGLLAACHGYFGGRTTDEDKELNNFAAARERAAEYYNGGDFARAAVQYRKALEYRPDHKATKLGLAYSLMRSDTVGNLREAEQIMLEMGKIRSEKVMETKRLYGLGLTYRGMADHFQRRSLIRRNAGRIPEAEADMSQAREYASSGYEYFERVTQSDDRYSSLRPDAHVGMAACAIILGTDEDYESAERHLNEFSAIAAKARRFWKERKERQLSIDEMRDVRQRVAKSEYDKIYDQRVMRTIDEEVAARRILMQTYLWNGQQAPVGSPRAERFWMKAIDEATKIMQLDPLKDEMLWMRGRAYAQLHQYMKAVTDMKEYRARQDLTVLTERLVNVNRLIEEYEGELRKLTLGSGRGDASGA